MGQEEETIILPDLDNSPLEFIVPSDIYVEIVEQPAENGFRFRYQSERKGKSIGCLHGETTNGPYKTYPKIKIVGYEGPASVVVSCVEENKPFRVHPHKLVGKNCIQGVCKVDVSPETNMTAVFTKMGIQCTTRREIGKSLGLREEIKVDPFSQGYYNSKEEMAKINLDSIRLAFQVFIGGLEEWIAIPPTVSNVIRNKNGHGENLKIELISDNEAPIEGGKKILLFTSRIDKTDIEVHFAFNKNNQEYILKGHMNQKDVHHQIGLSFITPPFPDQKITQKHNAKLYLFRPSDLSTSDSIDFYFEPNTQNDVENLPLAIRYVRKPSRKSHDKDKNSKIRGGGNVIVEKMESSGMIPGMSFTEQVLNFTEDHTIKKKIEPISFDEIKSVLRIEES